MPTGSWSWFQSGRVVSSLQEPVTGCISKRPLDAFSSYKISSRRMCRHV